MINVKDKLCQCGKIANFGYSEDKIPLFCSLCKLENMINLKDKKFFII